MSVKLDRGDDRMLQLFIRVSSLRGVVLRERKETFYIKFKFGYGAHRSKYTLSIFSHDLLRLISPFVVVVTRPSKSTHDFSSHLTNSEDTELSRDNIQRLGPTNKEQSGVPARGLWGREAPQSYV